jgi:hypothetical protein
LARINAGDAHVISLDFHIGGQAFIPFSSVPGHQGDRITDGKLLFPVSSQGCGALGRSGEEKGSGARKIEFRMQASRCAISQPMRSPGEKGGQCQYKRPVHVESTSAFNSRDSIFTALLTRPAGTIFSMGRHRSARQEGAPNAAGGSGKPTPFWKHCRHSPISCACVRLQTSIPLQASSPSPPPGTLPLPHSCSRQGLPRPLNGEPGTMDSAHDRSPSSGQSFPTCSLAAGEGVSLYFAHLRTRSQSRNGFYYLILNIVRLGRVLSRHFPANSIFLLPVSLNIASFASCCVECLLLLPLFIY